MLREDQTVETMAQAATGEYAASQKEADICEFLAHLWHRKLLVKTEVVK